ncbi:lipocalin family protein [Marimonas arenosa]|uniref:Lipocalin family protein n=1 Tax=Marimonas arenosa TaxID=1795305 RepID=A0AAE4B853_9RHOB|nr:lipocalin family protein [Marimonas arenosa]MDQ2092241.1 lipocalin family protein [Marimonas arenosa]
MKTAFAAAMLAFLAACVPVGNSNTARDRTVPMASQVDATAVRLSGDWVVRTSFSETARPGERLRLRRGQGGALWLDDIALPARGQGRFGGAGGSPEWWVLWLDADNRTAAIGTPGGEFGWIMDRKARGGMDRIRAAKEIMQWSGYDMARATE